MTVQVYLRWDGMTDQDREQQTYEPDGYAGGWVEGSAGFLHDFNRPNVVQCLVEERWHSKEVRIPADTLQRRLPRTILQLFYLHDAYCERSCAICFPDDNPYLN